MRDIRGGQTFEAQLKIVAVEERGLIATASSSEIFNTAVLDGEQLSSTISALIVYSSSMKDNAAPTSSLRCAHAASTQGLLLAVPIKDPA